MSRLESRQPSRLSRRFFSFCTGANPRGTRQRMRDRFLLCLWVFTILVSLPMYVHAAEVTLKWAPCNEATHYVVYWGTESKNYTRYSESIQQPSPLGSQITHNVTELAKGTTYYFAVKAFNACSKSSDFTNEVSKTTPAKRINADAGKDQTHLEITNGSPTVITLDGSASTSTDSTISSYQWLRVDPFTDTPTVLSSTTAAQPTFYAPNITSDTALKFELTVTNNEGDSDTDYVTITITNVEVDYITLKWIPCAEATHYVVYWGTESKAYSQSSVNIMQPSPLPSHIIYPVPGLKINTTYYFAVKAFNNCYKASDFTNEITKTTSAISRDTTPTADAGQAQAHPETANGIPTLITLDGSGSTDPDGSISAYHWARVDSYTDITTILSSTTAAQPSFNAPDVTEETALEFELTVTDNEGATATDRVQITITPVLPPTANPGPDQTINEGFPVTLNGSGSTDPDGSITGWLWEQVPDSQAPTVSLAGANTSSASFTAPNVAPGGAILTFKLTVTDNDGAINSATTVVNIVHINQRPTADAGATQTVDEGTSVTLNGTGSIDSDGSLTSWLWEQVPDAQAPTVALAGATTSTASFTAPDIGPDGATLTFKLTVTDNNGAKSSATTTVNVVFVNQPPTAQAGPAQTVNEGTQVTLNGAGSSDADGTLTGWLWEQVPDAQAPTVALAGATTSTASFTAPDIGPDGATLRFKLTVTDNNGAKSSATTTVNVVFVNQPPTAQAGPVQTVNEGTQVTLNGAGSSDADGTLTGWLWEQVPDAQAPTAALTGATTSTASFTAPDIGPDGATLTFKLTVTDNNGAKSSATTTVNVVFVNQPPT
ncbi:PKD domain-containing protein, partial [Desulfoluna sp.]|uniref:PKD domain-containing protein n=1 Tax=Desulfoluna sp. TaxID=2045199 RepID=UPI0026017C0B